MTASARRRLHRSRTAARWAWERRSKARRAALRASRRRRARPSTGWRAVAGDLGDVGRFVGSKVRERTTHRICLFCSPRQRVPEAEWNSHQQMHSIINGARGKVSRGAAAQRQKRSHQDRAADRPTNTRSGGRATPSARYAQHARDGTLVDHAGQVHAQGSPQPAGSNALGVPEWDGNGPPPASWTAVATPPRVDGTTAPTRPPSSAGARWKGRTTNPGTGNPIGTMPWRDGTQPAAPTAAPAAPTVSTTKGTPVAPRSGSSTKPTAGGGGGGGEPGLAAAARGWAMRLPTELNASRADTAGMNQDLHGVADALRQRMNLEVERGMDPSCVEPLEAAARLISQAGDQVAEVTARQEAKYRELADRLAARETPNAAYLSPENVQRGRG